MGMQESLESAGYTLVGPRDVADVFIINSCTVTGKTDRRSRHAVHQARRLNPDAAIIVTGCGAQRDAAEFSEIAGVKAILGNREKQAIVEYVDRILNGEEQIIDVSRLQNAPFEKLSISRFRNYTRAFLKIQEGCNRACTYCVIPSVRGPSRSQEPDAIIREIERLVSHNFREIVLTGIDLGTYGLDLDRKTTLVSLLDTIEKIPGLQRIRLSSIEPMEFSDALIDKITLSEKICRHFHIPLQSGSNRILDKMNRGYHREDYEKIVDRIRKRSPDACIGADIITGFPGETDADYNSGYAFIKSLPLDYLHVFTYSIRESTPAAAFDGKIDPEKARDRCHSLRALSQEKAERFRRRLIGKTLPVIILGAKDTRTGYPRSLSDNYIQVLIQGECPAKGNIVPVRLDTCDSLRCIGQIVKQ